MIRYDIATKSDVENPDVDKFVEELIDVCHKYGMCLSHEDLQGSFIVRNLDDNFIAWLRHAMIENNAKLDD